MPNPAIVLLAFVPAFAAAPQEPSGPDAPVDGRATVERLLDELLEPSAEHRKAVGELRVHYYESPEVNAFATRDDRGVSHVIVMEGIVDAFDGEDRLLRAVLAHELAHLVRGHVEQLDRPVSPLLDFADARYHFVRQVEFEADRVGVEILTAAGFPRGDLEDALLRLHASHRDVGVTWLQSIGSDHGSWVERVARIAPTETRFAALRAFERGLAFIECRRPQQAKIAFERALEIQPDFDEARYGVVRARLQIYYDNLPGLLREMWLRPDFGPQLTLDDVLTARGTSSTAADRRRWQAVRDAVDALPAQVAPALHRHLSGTVDVLHPGGDDAVVAEGVRQLQSGLLDPAIARRNRDALRLALANNASLGLLRLGESDAARRLLVAELEEHFDVARFLNIANAARLTELGVQGACGDVFVVMLQRMLRSSRVGSKRYDSARGALDHIGRSIGADLLEVEAPSMLQVCRPTEVIVEGGRFGLFTSIEDASTALGAPAVDDAVHPDYDSFRLVAWRTDGAADVVALVEDGRALKLTTYRPGSAVVLQPLDETDVRELRIEIGAKEADLVRLVSNLELSWPPVAGLRLIDRGLGDETATEIEDEAWVYLPDLALGVLLDEGVVRGLTITSAQAQ